MAAYKLSISEIRSYEHSIIASSDFDTDKVDSILTEIEKDKSIKDFDDIKTALKKKGFDISIIHTDHKGDLSEIEFNEFEHIKEEKE